jgi:hypothetical protein
MDEDLRKLLVKPYECKLCGENDKEKFYPGNKSNCRACVLRDKANMRKSWKSLKIDAKPVRRRKIVTSTGEPLEVFGREPIQEVLILDTPLDTKGVLTEEDDWVSFYDGVQACKTLFEALRKYGHNKGILRIRSIWRQRPINVGLS